ncbi:putative WD repeat-containing protein [Ceratocystis fimbriata CBS 114723]|uniref:Putative WD repeat-containing protein n=1 Tax=Ceratocystis fimbriata CBS 114723 TaxID=1035309 RepID=A0A2C5WYU6_9PEZI|nr:putative WD repeat-containing protein [Ceratocystis fimbriata CBS 114723]
MHPSRRAFVEDADEKPAADKGIALEDVPMDYEYNTGASGTGIGSKKASAILSQMERKRLAKTIAVPTDDTRVRAKLREFGEPITLFGEGLYDRRERLRELMTQELERSGTTGPSADGDVQDTEMGEGDNSDSDEAEEEFYTRGTADLLKARIDITKYSLPRAAKRIAFQKTESTIPLRTHVKFRKEIKEKLAAFELQGSQTAGDRHVSMTRIAPGGEAVAVGNWGGQIKIFDMPNLNEKFLLRGHSGKISGITWRPGSVCSWDDSNSDSISLATGGAEGHINLWSLTQDTPKASLQGHSSRVCRVEFHPSGRFVASASDDCTWRLWDAETTQELLLQEGHSRGVYAVSFNGDGSLIASGGLDSLGRIWDLRSGRTVMILDGHIRPIHALDWGSDGHRVISGSADGWIKCWDIRKVQQTAAIGAHTSAVSDLRWYKGLDDPLFGMTTPGVDDKGAQQPKKSGTFFVSSSYDRTVKVFSADDWAIVQTLNGHTGPVGSVDISQDSKWIVSGGHDRTIKLWGRNDGEGI